MVNLPQLENSLMKIIKLIVTTFILFIVLSGINVFAGGPSGTPNDPPCWPPPCVPIDGGISYLLAIGALYGGKKIYDISKKAE